MSSNTPGPNSESDETQQLGETQGTGPVSQPDSEPTVVPPPPPPPTQVTPPTAPPPGAVPPPPPPGSVAPPPPPPPPPGTVPTNAPGQWGGVPAGPPATPAYGPVPYQQSSNNAVIALVLAIVSWFICPIIAAIVALVFASKGKKEIEASGGRMSGQGMVLAAKIISWINIGIYAAFTIFFIIFFIIAAASGGLDPQPYTTPSSF